MLDQAVSEMKEDLIKMRQASAEVMSTQKMLETKYTQAQTSAVSAASCTTSYRKCTLHPQGDCKACTEAQALLGEAPVHIIVSLSAMTDAALLV